MNDRIYRACYSILDNFTQTDVNEVIEVLTRYNKCKADVRASCLANGCENDDSVLNRKIKPYRSRTADIKRFSTQAGAVYSGPSTSYCSSCGRAY